MMESAEDKDTALNEALSMLDSLTADDNDNNGANEYNLTNDGFSFAIDSDDDDENFNLEEELTRLEGIAVDLDGGAAEYAADTDEQQRDNNGSVGIITVATTATATATAINTTTVPSISSIHEKSSSRGDTDTNNVIITSYATTEHPSSTHQPTLAHPLQDFGVSVYGGSGTTQPQRPPANNNNTTTIVYNNNSNTNNAIYSASNNNNNNSSSSWTSSFASFAKVASASIQSAVETAEATLIHQGEPIMIGNGGGAGGSHFHQSFQASRQQQQEQQQHVVGETK